MYVFIWHRFDLFPYGTVEAMKNRVYPRGHQLERTPAADRMIDVGTETSEYYVRTRT